MYKMLKAVMILFFLAIGSWYDIKEQKIPLFLFLGAGISVIIILLLQGNTQWQQVLPGMLPGVALCFVGMLTVDTIGCGDGMALLILGSLLGVGTCIWIICISMTLTSLFLFIRIAVYKKSKTEKVAYFPFLLIAWEVLLI